MRNWLKISGRKVSPLNSILLEIMESRMPVNPWSRVSEAGKWIVYAQWERLCEEMNPGTQFHIYLEATTSLHGSGLEWVRKCFQGWEVKGKETQFQEYTSEKGKNSRRHPAWFRARDPLHLEMICRGPMEQTWDLGKENLPSTQASAHVMSSYCVLVSV